MTFRDSRAANQAVFFNVDQYAEPADYLQAGGLAVALIVMIQPAQLDEKERPNDVAEIEEIDVRMGRSPNQMAGDLQIGGISYPKLYDRLRRRNDPRPYALSRIVSSNDSTHLVRFSRDRVDQIGTGSQLK